MSTSHDPAFGKDSASYWCHGARLQGGQATLTFSGDGVEASAGPRLQ